MLSDSKYREVLRKLSDYAPTYAENEHRSGATGPTDGLFSGEWADGLTLQRVLDFVGQPALVEECSEFEREDFMLAFEDSYYAAWEDLLERV